jgi:hypothetical protein
MRMTRRMRTMSEKIYCTVLNPEDVKVEGDSLTFSIGGENVTVYLSEGAMSKVIGGLNTSLFEAMSKELRERQNTINDLRDALGMYDTSAKED